MLSLVLHNNGKTSDTARENEKQSTWSKQAGGKNKGGNSVWKGGSSDSPRESTQSPDDESVARQNAPAPSVCTDPAIMMIKYRDCIQCFVRCMMEASSRERSSISRIAHRRSEDRVRERGRRRSPIKRGLPGMQCGKKAAACKKSVFAQIGTLSLARARAPN